MNSNLSNMLAGAIVTHALSQPSASPHPASPSPRAPTAPSATPAPLTFIWTLRFALIDLADVPLAYIAGLAPALFAVRANIDFYKARILGNRAWW